MESKNCNNKPFQLVLSLFKGLNFVVKKHGVKCKFKCKLEESVLESKAYGLSTTNSDPEFNYQFAWTLDKKQVEDLRLKRGVVKIQCHQLDREGGIESPIGYCRIPVKDAIVINAYEEVDGKNSMTIPLKGTKMLWLQYSPKLQLLLHLEHPDKMQLRKNPGSKDGIMKGPLPPQPSVDTRSFQWEMNDEMGYFQLGKPKPNDDLYIVNITLISVRHLEELLAQKSAPKDLQWMVEFEAYGTSIQSDPFYLQSDDEVKPTHLGDKSTARIRTNEEDFKRYLKETEMEIKVKLIGGEKEDVVGTGWIALEPLTAKDSYEIRGAVQIASEQGKLLSRDSRPSLAYAVDLQKSPGFFGKNYIMHLHMGNDQNLERSPEDFSSLPDIDTIAADSGSSQLRPHGNSSKPKPKETTCRPIDRLPNICTPGSYSLTLKFTGFQVRVKWNLKGNWILSCWHPPLGVTKEQMTALVAKPVRIGEGNKAKFSFDEGEQEQWEFTVSKIGSEILETPLKVYFYAENTNFRDEPIAVAYIPLGDIFLAESGPSGRKLQGAAGMYTIKRSVDKSVKIGYLDYDFTLRKGGERSGNVVLESPSATLATPSFFQEHRRLPEAESPYEPRMSDLGEWKREQELFRQRVEGLGKRLDDALNVAQVAHSRIRALETKLEMKDAKIAELTSEIHQSREQEASREIDLLEQKIKQVGKDLDKALEEKEHYRSQSKQPAKLLEDKAGERQELLREDKENVTLQMLAGREEELLNQDLKQVASISSEIRAVRGILGREGQPPPSGPREPDPLEQSQSKGESFDPKPNLSVKSLQERDEQLEYEIERLARNREGLLLTQAYTQGDPLIRELEDAMLKNIQLRAELHSQHSDY